MSNHEIVSQYIIIFCSIDNGIHKRLCLRPIFNTYLRENILWMLNRLIWRANKENKLILRLLVSVNSSICTDQVVWQKKQPFISHWILLVLYYNMAVFRLSIHLYVSFKQCLLIFKKTWLSEDYSTDIFS